MRTLVTVCASLFVAISYGQAIRKDYREMTPRERSAYVNALYVLRAESADVIEDLAEFHDAEFLEIHVNLEPQDVFLAWHRAQILEFERAMQAVDEHLSVPYWNWTEDRSINLDMLDQDFLGQFDSNWNLGRETGRIGSLGTSGQVAALLNRSDYYDFSIELEEGIPHVGAHVWIGGFDGVMRGGRSPLDPVFYLHHGYVDKIFDDYTKRYNLSPASNVFQRTDMPRYDGTYRFNGRTLPRINPDNLVNANALGVFYAEGRQATLHDYTVSNEFNDTEVFYYQFSIRVDDDFRIPNGGAATIESGRVVRLLPGFRADYGSNALIKIDEDLDHVTPRTPAAIVAASHSAPYEPSKWSYADIGEASEDNSISLEVVQVGAVEWKVQIPGDLLQSNMVFQVYNLQGRLMTEAIPVVGAATLIKLPNVTPQPLALVLRSGASIVSTSKLISL